jgi:hypothetical protein
MVVHGEGIGHQNGGASGSCGLGHGAGAGAGDDEMGLAQALRNIVEEGLYGCVQV